MPRFGRCKFGSSCSYLHCDSAAVNDTLASDIEELKKALKQVMQIREAKENQIQKLEDKLHTVTARKTYRLQVMLYFPLLKHLGVQSLKTPSTSPSKIRQEKKSPLRPQDGFLILLTSVSTGSVILLPPVKVFSTNTFLMLTQYNIS